LSADPHQALFKMIDERRDDLVELVQALMAAAPKLQAN
jgi:hypothetical protein